jgi:ABC-type lipoprotein export system ATPase subunit
VPTEGEVRRHDVVRTGWVFQNPHGAARPDLFLVDEPTAQLDARTAAEVSRTLTGLARRGTVVVVATHDPHTRAACTDVIDLADLA